MKALLKNYHQSPRKVRLVADLIRGKSVHDARIALTFLPKKSSPAILKLLNSATANAKNSGLTAEELFVKSIAVNKGVVLKRFAPRARGSAARFEKTMSIVTLELGALAAQKSAPATKEVSNKPAAKKTVAQKPRAVKKTAATK